MALSRRLLRQGLLRRRHGIRFRLAMGMALALLPFVALSLLQLQGDWREQAALRSEALRLAAERSVADQRARVQAASDLLEVLALDVADGDCSARLQALDARLDDYRALGRIGPDGRVACASSDSIPAGRWLNRLTSGDAVVAEAAGRPPADLLVALRVDRPLGGFDGAAVAVMPLERLLPPTVLRGLPPGSQAAVVAPGGRALIATDADAFRSLPDMPAAAAEPGRAVVFRGRDPDGGRREFARAALVPGQLDVLYSAPAPGFWTWGRFDPFERLLTPLAVWLISFVAVMLLTERLIVRWLDYLQRVAAIYARGRLNVRPVQAMSAPTEIRMLARTLDDLASAVTARDESLTRGLHEKDALMREIHHRVKNNLQIISSMLSMQQRSLKDAAAKAALGDTRQRISALALIYRTLYQAEDLSHPDARDFLVALVGQLIASEAGHGVTIESTVDADSLIVDPDKLAPMALWLVEAVSNAQKHALGARGGRLTVRFKVQGEVSRLEVEDDGPGLTVATPVGVGRTLMGAFAKQLRGDVEVLAAPSGGALVRMTFATPSPR